MRRFAELFNQLDASTATSAKLEALQRYYQQAAAADAAWATYFLAGGKPRAVVNARAIRDFALTASGLPDWLFEESYQAVGDMAETIAHLLPPPTQSNELGLAQWIEERLLPLRGLAPADVLMRLREYVQELDSAGRFLLIKLISGGFRVGVSRLLVTRALARHAGVDAKVVAQRLIGYTAMNALPTAQRFAALISVEPAAVEGGTPYPFFLAHQLAQAAEQLDEALGPPTDWLVEWKYDGIRAQLVRRASDYWLWSRGEDLITERFPELEQAAQALPDGTVLDGEILVWDETSAYPAPFARLQTRVTRKTVTPKLLRDAPVVFVAYDLLEQAGQDLRQQTQAQRRAQLEQLVQSLPQVVQHRLRLSPPVQASSWAELAQLRQQSRARAVEGFMLKHQGAQYGVGRTKDVGTWWKWKIDPMTADCVLVYAQPGHGRRASLYTDYTFAVWDRQPQSAGEVEQVVKAIEAGESAEQSQARNLPRLVPFAKAYSGLTDQEIRQVDAVIRKSTIEKFGPVRSVVPSLVFELGFEGIQHSPRHKSGIAVRFPRILRWRQDKPLHEADTLANLQTLLVSE